MAPPDISAWQVESLRLTALSGQGFKATPESWWESLVGVPPETLNVKPKAGLHYQQGNFEGRSVALQVQPDRVDWIMTPAAPEEPPVSALSAGILPDAIGSFKKTAAEWLKVSPPVNRLAFGAILFQPVKEKAEGYRQLAEYLHAVKIDPDSSDFVYQINRPRKLARGITGLRVNRLSRWSVQFVTSIKISLERSSPSAKVGPGEEWACRLELDINTAPEHKDELPHGTLSSVFEQLVDLGLEIAAKGDVH